MSTKCHYTRSLRDSRPDQRRQPGRRLRKSEILHAGCRGHTEDRQIVFLATVLDQYRDQGYREARQLTRSQFPRTKWAIFEPARCDWGRGVWNEVWPRLARWIDVLVIWPRPDRTVGLGVYTEACDVKSGGKPVYVLNGRQLERLGGFNLLKGGYSRYARLRKGAVATECKPQDGGR